MLTTTQKTALKLLGFELRKGFSVQIEFVIEYQNDIGALKRYDEHFWRVFKSLGEKSNDLFEILSIDNPNTIWRK